MDSNSLKKSIVKGSIWTVGGQFISLFITLIANIWLARLLSPKEFGQLGIMLFFIAIAEVLTEGGLSGALIRKSNATKEDYSTIFIFNIAISIIGTLILIIFSHKIALFYNDLSLKSPLRILSIILILNALQMAQNTKLMADMKYKEKSIYYLISVFVSSIIGIYLAWKGYGLWSLISLQLSRALLYTSILWIFENFHFKLVFKKSSFRELYGFGVNTTLASFLSIGFDNIYQLIIGKILSISQVGLYYQAKKLQEVSNSVFKSLSQGVIFSSLSKIQKDEKHFYSYYSIINTIIVVILGLVTLIIFLYSDIIIRTLLGNEWTNSSFFLKFLSMTGFFFVLDNFTRVIFKVYNQTRLLLHLEILKKIIQLISIVIGLIFNNIQILLIGFIISNAIGYTLNYIFARRISKQLKWIDFKNTLFVFAVIIVLLIICFLFKYIFGLNIFFNLFLLTFILPSYFLILKYSNIYNLFSTFKKYRENKY